MKFLYGDPVKVIRGFYKGFTGKCVQHHDTGKIHEDQYGITFNEANAPNTVTWISENDLQALPREGDK